MTAVDAAVQAKKLGAEEVTIVYRRGAEQMGASRYEQELALTHGVVIRHWARPVAVYGENGALRAVGFAATADRDGRLVDTGETFELPADQLFKRSASSSFRRSSKALARCSNSKPGGSRSISSAAPLFPTSGQAEIAPQAAAT